MNILTYQINKMEELAKEKSAELNSEKEIKSPSDLYNLAKDYFEKSGRRIIFSHGAKALGYHFLYSLENGLTEPGLNIPSEFKILKPGDEELIRKSQTQYLNDPDIVEELREFMAPLILYRNGRSSDALDHALAVESMRAFAYNKSGEGEYKLGIAYNPATAIESREILAFVPELNWFDERIRHLKFEDIIRIFPPAEARMMKLIIGRIAVGRSGSVHPQTDKVIKHSFRKAGIIIGEPRIGKTITLNGFIDAFKFLGYNVAATGDFGSRFNQGHVITSNLACADDLTLKGLESMLSAHSFKSVVTGGTEKVESKGQDAVEVISTTTIIANCNEWLPTMIYSLDIGAVSRIAPISTYKHFELKLIKQHENIDVHPAVLIPDLAKKYQVSERSLYLKAIRDCTDFFIDLNSKDSADINAECEKIMPYLRIQMNKNALDVILRYGFLSYAIRYESLDNPWLPELTLSSFGKFIEALRFFCISQSAYDFRCYLKEQWEQKNRDYDHYWWCMRKTLITSIDQAYDVYLKCISTKDLSFIIEEVFKTIRLTDGVTVSSKAAHVIRNWEKIKGERDVIFSDAAEIISYMNEPASQLLEKFKVGTKCDSSYLYDSSYDPSRL